MTEIASQAPDPAATAAPGGRTIPRLWREGVADRTGVAYRTQAPHGWDDVTWAEAAVRVEELANGLLALGIGKGDVFAILGSTRLEWTLFDFALAHTGGVTAPIYANSSAQDVAYLLEYSDAIGILVEDEEQLAKVEQCRAGLPKLEHVLTFADLDELARRGRERNPPRSTRPSPRSTRTTSSPSSTRPAPPARRRAA
jgi:long-subunit acyl-CoA synthetase (AMP-forming)